MERLETERQVLFTEERSQGWSLPALLMNKRYGARGLGLCQYRQFGLMHLDAALVQAWAHERFNRSNAVLVVVGPDAGLWSLPLDDGCRWPLVDSEPIEHPLPARLEVPESLGLSFVVERSAEGSMAIAAAEKRLFERLRGQEGIAYSVSVDIASPSLSAMHATLLTNMLPENEQQATESALNVLGDLARQGISREELHFLVSRNQAVGQPDAFGGYWAQRMAIRDLLGMKPAGPEETRREFAAATPDGVLTQLRWGMQRALFAFPEGADINEGSIVDFQEGRGVPFVGPQLKPSPFVPSNGEHLVVASAGVSLVDPHHHPITVRFEDCALLLTFEEGARVLIGNDGQAVRVDPRDWEDAQPAVAAIDAAVPAERRVTMRPLPGEPAPARRMPGRIVFWVIALAGAAGLLWLGAQVIRALHLPYAGLSGLIVGYSLAVWAIHARLKGLWGQRAGGQASWTARQAGPGVGGPASAFIAGRPSPSIASTELRPPTPEGSAPARIRTARLARWMGMIHVGTASGAGLLASANLAVALAGHPDTLAVSSAFGLAVVLLSLLFVHSVMVIWVRDVFRTLQALGVDDLVHATGSVVRALTISPNLQSQQAVFHELITATDPSVMPNAAWTRLHHPMPLIWRTWATAGLVNEAVTFFAGIGIWLLSAGGLLRALVVIPVVALNLAWAGGLVAMVSQVSRNLPLRFRGTVEPDSRTAA